MGSNDMKKLKPYEIIGLAIILALTVFAGVSCTKANAGQELIGVTWLLKSYGDPNNLTQVITGNPPTLTFDKDKMTVTGNGGVNGYGGDYTVKGSELKVTRIISTLMASTNEALNKQENAFFKILGSVESYKIDGTQLTITGTEGILVFAEIVPSHP
jgi:heat shock protein HslJ